LLQGFQINDEQASIFPQTGGQLKL